MPGVYVMCWEAVVEVQGRSGPSVEGRVGCTVLEPRLRDGLLYLFSLTYINHLLAII